MRFAKKLSAKEKKRRESILKRYLDKDSSNADEVKLTVIEQLRDLPTAQLFDTDYYVLFSLSDKEELYEMIENAQNPLLDNILIKTWLLIRLQDLLELGHLPTRIECFSFGLVFGQKLAYDLISAVKTVMAEHNNKEIKDYASGPKNELETKIFEFISTQYEK